MAYDRTLSVLPGLRSSADPWWRPLATEQKVGSMKLTKQGLQAEIKELEDS